MYFCDYFKVKKECLDEYGALNISLDSDIPAYIDPLLIFVSNNKSYKKWHDKIVKYVLFLASTKKSEEIDRGLIKTFFTFKEVKNNWLGLSMSGNEGNALGMNYGISLYRNINNIVETNGISTDIHFEKLCLFEDGVGKDKISDFTTNILLSEFAEYTEKFARKHIPDELCKDFRIDRADFDFDSNAFVPRTYHLPYIEKKGKKEYVLLTPKDILRSEENSINKQNFYSCYEELLETIDNDALRYQFSLYISSAIQNLYDNKQKLNKKPDSNEVKEQEKKAINEFCKQHPEIYDYFIRMQEDKTTSITNEAINEIKDIEELFLEKAKALAEILKDYRIKKKKSAFKDSLEKISYFKKTIEENGLYKDFYYRGKPISSEACLQRLFRLVWINSEFCFSSEVNDGNGPVDFEVSYGSNDKCLIEFKLAKNTKLNNVFAQVEAYKKASSTNKAIIIVFYFNDKEKNRVDKLIEENKTDMPIVSIDCRDNKLSASNRK